MILLQLSFVRNRVNTEGMGRSRASCNQFFQEQVLVQSSCCN